MIDRVLRAVGGASAERAGREGEGMLKVGRVERRRRMNILQENVCDVQTTWWESYK